MKKKRIFAGLLAGAVLTAGLAGCGSTPSSSTAPSGSAAASGATGVVEVTIPSYKTGENVGAVFFEPQVERFNQAYEGKYHITLESVPQDTFLDQMKMLAQQGELPVLVQSGDVDWLTNVVYPNGLAYDLSGWLDEHPDLKARLLPDGLAFCTDDSGAVYSMPLATVRPTGFFWNSALWDTQEDLSAMTMDQFITAMGDQKIAFSTAENGWVAALFLTAAIADEEGGIDWLQAGVENRITDFSEPAFVNAIATLQQMLQNNAAPNSIGATYADAANSFMSNQAALIANAPGCRPILPRPTAPTGATALTAPTCAPPSSRVRWASPTPPPTASGSSAPTPHPRRSSWPWPSWSSSTAPRSWKPTCWRRAATPPA